MAWAELAGDWLEPLCGEAVPELPSFFLASLLPSRSLARESCSCCQTSSSTRPRTGNEWERGGVGGQHTTRCLKPFMMGVRRGGSQREGKPNAALCKGTTARCRRPSRRCARHAAAK